MIDRLTQSDQTEFERIKEAKRGSIRLERSDDYVTTAHCHTVTLIAELEIRDTRWYVSVNYKERQIARTEVSDTALTYDVLITYIVGVIVTHKKGQIR